MAAANTPPREAGRALRSDRIGPVQKLRLAAELLSNFGYDARRYLKRSYLFAAQSRDQIAARIMADAHFLEYGMALREARPGFGRARALRLANDLERLIEFDSDNDVLSTGITVLDAFVAFNANDPEGLEEAAEVVARLHRHVDAAIPAGVRVLARDEIHARAKLNYVDFAQSRHSVRQFEPGPAPDAEIRRAVEAAQAAPSSCNRQTCHVHAFTDPVQLERVRKMQAGNRTFGHELSGLLVVTSNLAHWETVGERYQPWIDGGLFAMSLLHGLHAEGLGTCMLNWSVDKAQDKALRALMGLGDDQLVIVMIGMGWLPEHLTVCASNRLETDGALTFKGLPS